MENLQTRTTNKVSNKFKYEANLNEVITFLRHDEDKIIVKSQETVNFEIYDNGKPIFLGDKYELFQILRNAKENREYIEGTLNRTP